jgi:hypothetical protein
MGTIQPRVSPSGILLGIFLKRLLKASAWIPRDEHHFERAV